MAGPHENLETAEHAEHAAHSNKKIALLISVLALFLAFSETLGKSAQTSALTLNVTSNDLWSFFQAKTIRMTVLSTAAEQMQIEADRTADADVKARLLKTIDTWKKTATRYNDEPETHEGRKQLSERAKEAEHQRDEALARYHNYEFASAAFQIGIVLASATIITGMLVLAWLSGALGELFAAFMGFRLVIVTCGRLLPGVDGFEQARLDVRVGGSIGLDLHLLRRRAQHGQANGLGLEKRPQVVGGNVQGNGEGLCALAQCLGERQEQRQHRDQQRDLLVGMRRMLGMLGMLQIFVCAHRPSRNEFGGNDDSKACRRARGH